MSTRRHSPNDNQRLTDTDWIVISVCIALALASVAIVIRYFDAAFPQAPIEFRFDRNSSRGVAERFLDAQKLTRIDSKHAARFDSDDSARIFLERSLGLEEANRLMSKDVHVWYWHHRWYRPLVEEELSVDVAPSGEIVGFMHRIPEDRAAPAPSTNPPTAFLASIGVDVAGLNLIDQSERRLPKRVQRIFTWESGAVRPAGAQYRHVVTVDGNQVTSYTQHLKVPEAWQRSYREMRSKNQAAGAVDMILNAVLMIAATVIFIIRLRRGDLPIRFLLGVGAAAIVLVGGVALNSIPAQLAWYDTTTSYPAFIGQLVFQTAMQSLGMAMLLIVICGAGEVLYRQRLPKQLAMPSIWNRSALTSKRVFLSLVIGYALVPLFIGYQVVFYLAARRAGAWAPAEVPYDDILNSALPWMAVLFAGFFPAFSEEFLSRAFAIPFIQKLGRSRVLAIVAAAFIWGFGHSTYPNQPFWIRGVEVGLAGIAAGFLMDRFGLLPLLIWHYTIDAVYTATLLFGSGNTYYIVSAAIASLLFAFPLLASIFLYLRNRGFVPDGALSNEALPEPERPAPPPPEPHEESAAAALPEVAPLTRRRVLLCVVLLIAAAVAVALLPLSPSDALDYRLTAAQAKQIAEAHVRERASDVIGRTYKPFAYVIAAPVEGFRSWNPDSGREEGGSPGGFDEIAATWLVHNGVSIPELVDIFRTRVEAGTWTVRFFTPMQKEEVFVEIDPRTSRVVGYHRYQDEQTPGRNLPRDRALLLARSAFLRYGMKPENFELKEALTFQQPRRRDWLFHFDEKATLSPAVKVDARRRVTVRVAGAQVTQFSRTVNIPESVYREATTQTLLNVILFALKIAGLVALLGLAIGGLIIASRRHGLPWRRPLRWTLALAVIPVASFAARIEPMLFGYSTATAWETFRVGLITAFVRDVGLQLGLLFVALAGIEASLPYAARLLRSEGIRRYGRPAAVAALTALAALAIGDALVAWVARLVPSAASVELFAPSQVAVALPALVDASQAIVASIVLSAAVALYSLAVRKHAGLITIAAVFCAVLDPLVTTAQAPLMFAYAAGVALLTWIIGRYVLNGNPLAWPLAIFIGSLVRSASVLLHNHRPDLTANGVALIVIAVAVLIFVWRREVAALPSS